MNLKDKFLKLTAKTCPHGYEEIFVPFLPKGYNKDAHGNYFLKIGEEPTTMFTCHLDTACNKMEKVKHVFLHDNEFVGTDGTTILGADDKAGMVIMLHMIENKVPGLYYFFLGEEVGCIGSKRTAKDMWLKKDTKITKVVSFDRRGYKSVITHQFYGRCCSDEFALELSKQLNQEKFCEFEPDDTGICTDSIQFQDFIPECTNISVGYFNEHTGSEVQNLYFLQILAKAVLKVDWEKLPVRRDPSFEEDWSSYNLKRQGKGTTYTYSDGQLHTSDEEVGEDVTFSDEFYLFNKDENNVEVKYLVAKERITYEISLLCQLLVEWGYDSNAEDIVWDGNVWRHSFMGEPIGDVMNRKDLANLNPEFAKMPNKYLKKVESTEAV